MAKIDFTHLEVPVSFDGTKQMFNVAKSLGNAMMYNGSVLMDIGFEDLARRIYYSEGEVEVEGKYVAPIEQVVKDSNFIATIKREIIRKLRKNKNSGSLTRMKRSRSWRSSIQPWKNCRLGKEK